jgi:hypothetical protein
MGRLEGPSPMSALGHKRTFAVQNGMSALPPKADMCGATRDVRFVPIADIPAGATQRLSCPGSCARWRAFTPCSKSVPKWSRIPLLNHPTVTRGPRCRYLFSHKAGTDTRQHVMANHVAATQEPDEAAHFSCKVRSSWLTSDNELCPTCCQAKQASQTLSGKVM